MHMVELNKRHRRSRAVALLLASSAASGCAGGAVAGASAPCTLQARLRLEASERINPDQDGTALPTLVRVYLLQTLARLEAADFVALWSNPDQTLGHDLLGARELTLFPGQVSSLELGLTPETHFVAAVAIYRQPTSTRWRSIVALPESSRSCAAYRERGVPSPALRFSFDRYSVEARSYLLPQDPGSRLPHDVAPSSAPSEAL
jgi:type VI secretion system protein VasD